MFFAKDYVAEKNRVTDRRTHPLPSSIATSRVLRAISDQQTDRPTDKAAYRVASTRPKNLLSENEAHKEVHGSGKPPSRERESARKSNNYRASSHRLTGEKKFPPHSLNSPCLSPFISAFFSRSSALPSFLLPFRCCSDPLLSSLSDSVTLILFHFLNA